MKASRVPWTIVTFHSVLEVAKEERVDGVPSTTTAATAAVHPMSLASVKELEYVKCFVSMELVIATSSRK